MSEITKMILKQVREEFRGPWDKIPTSGRMWEGNDVPLARAVRAYAYGDKIGRVKMTAETTAKVICRANPFTQAELLADLLAHRKDWKAKQLYEQLGGDRRLDVYVYGTGGRYMLDLLKEE